MSSLLLRLCLTPCYRVASHLCHPCVLRLSICLCVTTPPTAGTRELLALDHYCYTSDRLPRPVRKSDCAHVVPLQLRLQSLSCLLLFCLLRDRRCVWDKVAPDGDQKQKVVPHSPLLLSCEHHNRLQRCCDCLDCADRHGARRTTSLTCAGCKSRGVCLAYSDVAVSFEVDTLCILR